MKIKFNDGMKNRGREPKWCVIYEGKAYSESDAVEKRLAKFTVLKYTKNGKWSNSDIEVETKSAKFVYIISPFDGWTNYKDALEYIKNLNPESNPTLQECELAFEFLYPKTSKEMKEAESVELL